MSFRQRLALFLVITLIAVQTATVFLIYGVVRHNLVEQGKQELVASTEIFMRQLNVLSERVSDGVEVLSLDYALRKAIAEDNRGTILSALRNHGARVGATRMLLVGLDGKITADTRNPDGASSAFPFGDLLGDASEGDRGTALAVMDQKLYWIVVVPVRAPVPIAFIVAGVPVDNALLEKLRELSSVSRSIGLATQLEDGSWRIVSQSVDYEPYTSKDILPLNQATIVDRKGEEHLTLATALHVAKRSAPVIAIMDYPLEEALSPYRAILLPMLFVLSAALVAALAGAMLIARGVSRPLEELAASARRIASGDYTPLQPEARKDEVGQLSTSLSIMTQSIAERQTALEVARNEAVQANTAKSQFLSNMSHELRTPLNAIIGFSEMIHSQMLGPVGVKQYIEYAGHMRESGQHLLSQVEEMLALSDADSGALKLSFAAIDLEQLLGESIEALMSMADDAKVQVIRNDQAVAWPTINGDDRYLRQSLSNLLHNAVSPSSQVSWLDGGFGKLRFNNEGSGFYSGEAVFDGRAQVTPELMGFISLRAADYQRTPIDVLEAYIRYRPVSTTPWRWSIKLGAFFPPISLENSEVGWTSYWTLTPSAINTWVGEELRTIGGEAKIEWRREAGTVSLIGSLFGWNDPAGILLADRGWAMGDLPTGLFDHPRLPDGYARSRGRPTPMSTLMFSEIDEKPGWYVGVNWEEQGLGTFRVMYYDNNADPTETEIQVAWKTDFWAAGMQTEIAGFEILAQGMSGSTLIKPSPFFRSNTDFNSAYLLVGKDFGNWRVAGRYDIFTTDEVHTGGGVRMSEHGHAGTLALTYVPREWLRLTLEALRIDSTRAQRVLGGIEPRTIEDQLQLSTRFLF